MKKKTTNYDFFVKTDTAQYKGKWIAISDKKVLAFGKDAQTVYKKAKQENPNIHISLAKIPDKQMMVLNLYPPK